MYGGRNGVSEFGLRRFRALYTPDLAPSSYRASYRGIVLDLFISVVVTFQWTLVVPIYYKIKRFKRIARAIRGSLGPGPGMT